MRSDELRIQSITYSQFEHSMDYTRYLQYKALQDEYLENWERDFTERKQQGKGQRKQWSELRQRSSVLDVRFSTGYCKPSGVMAAIVLRTLKLHVVVVAG